MKSLEEQMAAYGAAHRRGGTRLTHFVGVPIIVFSLMVLGALVRIPIGLLEFSLAGLGTGVLLGYYLRLDLAIGAAMIAAMVVLLVFADWIAAGGTVFGLTVGISAFVGGWILQFVGHGVWEKRKPALFDDVFQVFVAPIFLMAELFFAMGFKKELERDVERRIAASH